MRLPKGFKLNDGGNRHTKARKLLKTCMALDKQAECGANICIRVWL